MDDQGQAGTGTNGQATHHAQAGDVEGKAPRVIEYSRFSEVTEERNRLREQLLEARTQVAGFQTERQAWESRLREAEQAREWAGNVASLAREGIHDPDVLDYVKYQHSKAEPKDGRPPAFEDWWKGYRESKPAVLAPFLDKQAAAPPPKGAAATIDAGARAVGSAAKVDPGAMTTEQYRAWRGTPEGQAMLKGGFKPGGA